MLIFTPNMCLKDNKKGVSNFHQIIFKFIASFIRCVVYETRFLSCETIFLKVWTSNVKRLLHRMFFLFRFDTIFPCEDEGGWQSLEIFTHTNNDKIQVSTSFKSYFFLNVCFQNCPLSLKCYTNKFKLFLKGNLK